MTALLKNPIVYSYLCMVVLFAFACSSGYTLDQNSNHKLEVAEALKQYAGTDDIIHITYSDSNEEKTVEGNILKGDSPDVIRIMITESSIQKRVITLSVAQIEEMTLIKVNRSAVTWGEFNSFVQGKKGRAVYVDGRVSDVQNVVLTDDTLLWTEANAQIRVPVSKLNYVSFTNHTTGFLKGGVIGLLGGGALGFLLGSLDHNPCSEEESAFCGRIWSQTITAIQLAVAGVVGGSIFCAMIGNTTTYYFGDSKSTKK